MTCRWMWAALTTALAVAVPAHAQRCDDRISSPAADAYGALLPSTRHEQEAIASTHLPWGIPNTYEDGRGELLLYQRDYVLAYDADLRVATWAAHRLTRETAAPRRDRAECQRIDVRLAGYDGSTGFDYAGAVFERGRLVPSADVPGDPGAIASTDLLSNGAPQYPRFRAGIWARLERHVRAWASTHRTVYVITGAIFDRDGDGRRDADGSDVVRWMPPTELVAVPSAYFKIVARRSGSRVEALAIVVPHTDDAVASDRAADAILREGLRSIDAIEAMTGVDFFSALDDAEERALEAARAPDLWPLGRRPRRTTSHAVSARSTLRRAPGAGWRTPSRGAMAGG